MKTLTLLLSLLILTNCTTSQKDNDGNKISAYDEFTIYENGLIYDEPTMFSLNSIVDSLNLRFKSCTPKTYYSLAQGYASYIFINEKNVRKARASIAKNITLNAFRKQFSNARTLDSLWIVKSRDNYDEKPVLRYDSQEGEQVDINVPDSPSFDKSQGWIYEETYEGMEILYLHGLESKPIPAEYGRLIQYVDCMIDTTSTIFPAIEIPDSLKYPFASDSKVKAFLDLVMDFEPRPPGARLDLDVTSLPPILSHGDSLFLDWNNRRLSALDQKMMDPVNVQLLNDAVDESTIKQNGMFLDEYAARYLPPARQLELKRSFRVYGYCSADIRPRNHAVSICMLAAKCRQWDIFLRAHLDILNDNFERISDGAYAWAGRGTYIKEVEELDINSIDLIVGTILNAQDFDENHYLAKPYRVGRAMSESKYKIEFEDLLLQMICDERLDLYNRMQMAFALIFYNDHSKDENTYRSNLERVKSAIETLPGNMEERYANLVND